MIKHTNSQKFILFFSNVYFKSECEFGRHLNVKQIPRIILQESKHESPFSIIHKWRRFVILSDVVYIFDDKVDRSKPRNFDSLQSLLCLHFFIDCHIQSSCNDLHWKSHFSFVFYAEKRKIVKLQFLVTKRGQIPNLIIGNFFTQKYGGFHLSDSSSDELFEL